MKTEIDLTNPINFVPKMSYQFILNIDGIDSFLVRKISRSEITTETGQSKKMKVWFHDCIVPSAEQQIRECFKHSQQSTTNLKIELKELDKLGTVISQTSWEYCRISAIRLSDNDYSSSPKTIKEIEVVFDLGPETFHF